MSITFYEWIALCHISSNRASCEKVRSGNHCHQAVGNVSTTAFMFWWFLVKLQSHRTSHLSLSPDLCYSYLWVANIMATRIIYHHVRWLVRRVILYSKKKLIVEDIRRWVSNVCFPKLGTSYSVTTKMSHKLLLHFLHRYIVTSILLQY